MYNFFLKRFLDIICSLMAIILLAPIFLITAIAVRIAMGSPILFSQERIGKDERPFRLYKFRSMTNKCDSKGIPLPEKQRLTKFGRWLRSSSLDELPELFSILKGDMSFIGPRPLPTYYKPYFHDHERLRHKVRGGLIPPDSLSGKAYTTWEEQFDYEVNYVRHLSLLLDIKVFFMTFKVLFQRVDTDYGSDFQRPHLNEYRAQNNKINA